MEEKLDIVSMRCGAFLKLWDDAGTGCKPFNCQIFRPIPPLGHRIVSDVCESSLNTHFEYPAQRTRRDVYVVPSSHPLVAPPTSYHLIWESSSMRKQSKFGVCAVWRPVPPEGFVAMGSVLSNGHADVPPRDLVRCIHRSVVKTTTYLPNPLGAHVWSLHCKQQWWSDRKSGCKSGDVSFWKANAGDDVSFSSFFARPTHSQPSEGNDMFVVCIRDKTRIFGADAVKTDSDVACEVFGSMLQEWSAVSAEMERKRLDEERVQMRHRALSDSTERAGTIVGKDAKPTALSGASEAPQQAPSGVHETSSPDDAPRSRADYDLGSMTFLVTGMMRGGVSPLLSMLFGPDVSHELGITHGVSKATQRRPYVCVHPIQHNLRIIHTPGFFDANEEGEEKRVDVPDPCETVMAFLARLSCRPDCIILALPFPEAASKRAKEALAFVRKLVECDTTNEHCQVIVVLTAAGSRTAGVVGLSLTEMLEREGKTCADIAVPTCLQALIDRIRATALESEGIFRESGSASRIQHIDSLLFKGESISGLEEKDLHAMCGLLKRILREMPDQLFSLNADDKARIRDCLDGSREDAISSFRRALLFALDPTELLVVREVSLLMADVLDKEHKNRMSARNLGIVFGPTLCVVDAPEDCLFAQKLASFLASNAREVFANFEELQRTPSTPAALRETESLSRWKSHKGTVTFQIQSFMGGINGGHVPVICVEMQPQRSGRLSLNALQAAAGSEVLLPDGSSWVQELADAIVHVNSTMQDKKVKLAQQSNDFSAEAELSLFRKMGAMWRRRTSSNSSVERSKDEEGSDVLESVRASIRRHSSRGDTEHEMVPIERATE